MICIHGHYVCNECHTAGMDAIISLCLEESSVDPVGILEAIDFVRENFGITMDSHKVTCTRSSENNQCIGKRCPFSNSNL